ncbi:type II toxin-antitoxin system PemK/MazF family toxin [Oscillospiraceae bacterium 50-58]
MKRERPDDVLRGQMYYADLDPVIGSEQGGTRPVLVIQNNVGNSFSPTIIIAPITTRVKKLRQPTHIGIPPFFGLPKSSMAMLEQIRTIDKSRLGDYVGCLDDDVMDYIDEALGISVGLQDPSGGDRAQGQRPADEPHDDVPDEMVLTLCGTCLRQFIYSPEYIVRRIDRTQTKEPCMYCHVRDGYDYRIIHKKKRLGDDRY